MQDGDIDIVQRLRERLAPLSLRAADAFRSIADSLQYPASGLRHLAKLVTAEPLLILPIAFVAGVALWLTLRRICRRSRLGRVRANSCKSKGNIMIVELIKELTYRTASGKYYFKFALMKLPNSTIQINILQTLNYKDFGRSDSNINTHRNFEPGYQYVCWKGDQPTTVAQAKAIAKAWAEHTEAYCETGENF
jgi:hypothetical protein